MKFLLPLALIALIGFAVAQSEVDEETSPFVDPTEKDADDVTEVVTKEVTDTTTEKATEEATTQPAPAECPEGYVPNQRLCVTICKMRYGVTKWIPHPEGTPCKIGRREGKCTGQAYKCRRD